MTQPDHIAWAPYRIGLLPAWGGRVASIDHDRFGALIRPVEVGDGYDPLAWPKTGAFPLIPFHGRIEDARFQWQGVEVRLAEHPGQQGHALHGPAQRRPWEIETLRPDTATLRCAYASDSDWPWDFTARQILTATADGVLLRLEIENTSATPMPAGIGWHPYFPKASRIHHDARTLWPPRAGTLFPSGQTTALQTATPQTATPQTATPQTTARHTMTSRGDVAGRTTFLSDWSLATLDYATHAIDLRGCAALGHLVIHDDPPTHTCLEPASDPANAMNLPNPLTLAPGQMLAGEVSLSVRAR